MALLAGKAADAACVTVLRMQAEHCTAHWMGQHSGAGEGHCMARWMGQHAEAGEPEGDGILVHHMPMYRSPARNPGAAPECTLASATDP